MQSAESIHAAYAAGQRAFGENYAQELIDKVGVLPADIAWHFVGHLQRNKVKLMINQVQWVHGLDSERLAAEIAHRASAPVNCLLAVNIAHEATKHGVAPEQVIPLLSQLHHYAHVRIRGLMGMPPPCEHAETNRIYFRRLAELLAAVNAAACYPTPLHELSMGMSGDFEVAIEEGATMVRIGEALFGPRPVSHH